MDLLRAENVLVRVAQENGVDVETVIWEIERAVQEAMDTDDVTVHARWDSIPRAGAYPTAVEVVAYLGDGFGGVI